MANKNMGAYERFQEGVATFAPAGIGLLAGIAIEGPKWAAEAVQEKFMNKHKQAVNEGAGQNSLENVVQLQAAQRIGHSVLESKKVA